MIHVFKKAIKITVGTALVLTSVFSASAQDAYPSRPIKIVVPYVAGGVADTFSRTLANRLQTAFGQPVIVENKPGGSQIIGAMATLAAPADGYTILVGSTTSLAVNPHTQKDLKYDPIKDFAPISNGMTMPLFLVVTPSVPANNVKEFVELLKKEPNKYSFGSIGNGSSTHMAAEEFMKMTGTKMLHVPYKSSAPAVQDLLGGHIQVSFDVGLTSLPLVKEGKLKALGVGGTQRSMAMPEVPTIAESGVPGYEATVWFALVAKAGTPKPIIDKLSSEINKILRMPDLQAEFAPKAVDLTPTTPEGLEKLIKSQLNSWGAALKAVGITAQ